MTESFPPLSERTSLGLIGSAPGRSRGLAAAALIGCAVFGLYLGVSRSLAGGTETYRGSTAGSDQTPLAKAIAPPPAPTLDEAAVRRMAREEAQALVAKAAAPRRTASAPSADSPARTTTPSEAGYVYARPARSAPSDDPPPPPPAAAPAQLDQY